MAKLSAKRHASTDEAIASYLAKVDAMVEAKRSMPAAKADAYRAKYEDACGILDGNQSTGWVASEAAETGASEKSVAESVVASRRAWEVSQAALEAKRVAAKASIRQCQSPQDMHAVIESLKTNT